MNRFLESILGSARIVEVHNDVLSGWTVIFSTATTRTETRERFLNFVHLNEINKVCVQGKMLCMLYIYH